MARRGRCRCGTVLLFEKSEQGYKTKCNLCGAVVRLEASKPAPPAPAEPSPFSDLDSLPELEPPQAAPEIPVAAAPSDPASWLLWLAVGLAFIVVAIGVAIVHAN